MGDSDAEMIDLPGTYSMSANSLDESIVLDVLNSRMKDMRGPDVVVCIADACALRRNMLLVSQIATLGLPMVLVLNQSDGLKKLGLAVDTALLEKRLGIQVISAVGTKGVGMAELKSAIADALERQRLMKSIFWPECVNKATAHLRHVLSERGKHMLESELHRLMFDAHSHENLALGVEFCFLREGIDQAREMIRKGGYNPLAAEAVLHYRNIDALLEGVVTKKGDVEASTSESIDHIMLHRLWGFVIFIGMMYLVFQSVYSWAGPLMDGIEFLQASVQNWVTPLLVSTPMLQSLVSDGVIEGVGAFLVFLPQILILFFFVALLEDTGYMARAAFLMDRVFSGCGLNGKSFVPLLSSYACAIPGIMATRTIEDSKTRLATIFVAPFMSCSARLPVYVLMIGAFIQPKFGALWAGFTLFAMHFVGLMVAVPTAWLLTRFVFKTKSQPFVMELPRYRVPRVRDVIWRMTESGIEFCKRAGSTIFAITILIWALLYFPQLTESEEQAIRTAFIETKMSAASSSPSEVMAALDQEGSATAKALRAQIASVQINQSYMGTMGKTLQPVFAWAGYDWKITVGLLASFPAREIFVSTMGIIHSLGGNVDEESNDLRTVLAQSTWQTGKLAGQPIFTVPVVVSIMVFFALCSQCGATTAVIVKEAGWKWAILSFTYMTGLAWLGAVLTYQMGTYLFY